MHAGPARAGDACTPANTCTAQHDTTGCRCSRQGASTIVANTPNHPCPCSEHVDGCQGLPQTTPAHLKRVCVCVLVMAH